MPLHIAYKAYHRRSTRSALNHGRKNRIVIGNVYFKQKFLFYVNVMPTLLTKHMLNQNIYMQIRSNL